MKVSRIYTKEKTDEELCIRVLRKIELIKEEQEKGLSQVLKGSKSEIKRHEVEWRGTKSDTVMSLLFECSTTPKYMDNKHQNY